MDLNNLYPTLNRTGVGYTYNQFLNQTTDTIYNLGVSDSYFLGYVDPTLLPSSIFPTKVFFEDNDSHDNGTIIIESASKNNALIGYCDGSFSEFSYSAIGFIQNDGDTTYRYNTANFRYYNNFYPEFMSFGEKISLVFRYITYDGGDVYQSFSVSSKQINTYADVKRFLDGYIDLVLSIGGKDYNVNYNNLIEGNGTIYVESTDGTGWHARLFLINIWIGGGSTYNRSYSTSYGATHYIKTFGSFSDGTSGYFYNFGQLFGQSALGSRYCGFSTGRHGSGTREVLIPSGIDRGSGLFNSVEISESELPYNRNEFIYRDGILVKCETSDAYYVFYTYITNPASIKFLLGLSFRTNPGRVASYVENSSYATDVSGTKFEASLKTGDINNPQFKSQLMPWQYVDLETYDSETNPQGAAVNDFVTEDLPPYEPVPPTPTEEEGNNPENPELILSITDDTPEDNIEDAEFIDTNISFPVSAFMTQYILSAQDIFDMGTALWQGVGDPSLQTLDNFARTYQSTGTFNLANIMDFFVSVKIFPFDLTILNILAYTNAMTVGTGAVPLLNKPVPYLTASTCTVECGTVSTITESAYRLSSSDYDFRNYVNTSISCFLPYCGTVELNPADVFGFTLTCRYFVDLLSGSCTACVYATRDGNSQFLVGSKSGQIGKLVPISANNVMGVIGAAMSDIAGVAQTIGSAVITAATNKALGSSQMPINDASKNADYLKEVANWRSEQNAIRTQGSESQSYLGMATKSVSDLGSTLSRSGVGTPSLGAGTGLDALHVSKRPYIVIRKMKYSSPNNYAHTTGWCCTDGMKEKTLGDFKGWTVLENPDLSNIDATLEELSEIRYLLESGVYV